MTSDASSSPAVTENLLGRRIVAAIIDSAALFVVFIVFVALFGESDTSDSGFSFNLTGAPFLAYLLVVLAYYIGFEALTAQTPGKMVMGLKVAATQGDYTTGKVVVRNLLRFVDGLPFLYLVGLITAAVTSRHQRIGDLVAGTVIVRA